MQGVQGQKSERPILIVGAALIALAFVARPALEEPYWHQSWWVNWSWLDQFARQVFAGDLYPRWLNESHGGLGAPSFYYYPPLAFFLALPLKAGGLSTDQALVGVNALVVFLAALCAHAWFRAAGRRALLPALLYASAPFFAFDILFRGALAELLAYAVLPLVGLGILRTHRDGDLVTGAVAVALLLFSHLLIAMLAILFLAIPYALSLSRAPRDVMRMIAPFVVGLLIAAVFVVPAIALEGERSTQVLWGRTYFSPAYWNLVFREKGPFIAPLLGIITLSGVSALAMFWMTRSWTSALALVVAIASSGIVPLFDVPLLDRVQFPFRAAGFVPLWLCFSLAVADKAGPKLVAAAALGHFMLPVLAVVDTREKTLPRDFVIDNHADVVEMLPPGTIKPGWSGNGRYDAVAVRRFAEADAQVAPRYWFPIWQSVCDGRRAPAVKDDSGLIRLPAADCTIERRTLGVEWLSWGLTLLGLVLLLIAWRWRRHLTRRG
ncbi:hypothetical protein WJS89_03500 [Sphingomicrobium sp. XHP0235]|uniref:hypothetical protein n=1 Tax=Sphingomicrobium aquimarinum TaxID=3133971 RepID=UPI0031FF0641